MTEKQDRFVAEFLIDLNATQAAIRAGYSENGANVTACQLLTIPSIAKQVGEAMRTRSVETKIDSAWVLKRASLLADFNLNRFVRVAEDGSATYDFTRATDDDWYCISELTITQANKGRGMVYPVERVKLKAHSTLRALELVGKHIDVQAWSEKAGLDITMAVTAVRREIVAPGHTDS